MNEVVNEPKVVLSQLEYALEERQRKDRRDKSQTDLPDNLNNDRRKEDRRV
jgi:hypothetical protein